MSREFSIISAGPGQPAFLTARARQAIIDAGARYACGRIAGMLTSLCGDWRLCPAEDVFSRAAEAKEKQIAIVIAGDAGCYGGIQELAAQLRTHGAVRVYPGISDMQYFCAQLGESYDDARWIDHGSCDVLAALSYHRKVLLSGVYAAGEVCEELCCAGLGGLRVAIGIRLGTGREQIIDSTAEALRGLRFDAPAALLLFNEAATDPLRPIFDADMTMAGAVRIGQEVRWNAANLLQLSPADTVYDLGAGNGAASMEFARRVCEGRVFAVEEDAAANDLIMRNRQTLGCYNVRLAHGQAISAMQPLPAPNAAFIGPDAGNLQDILTALKKKNEQVRVVIAADSAERLGEAQTALAALKFRHIEISQLLLSHARTLGSYTMMLAGETMFLLSARKG